ncbi:hypothetical protein DLAC_03017 [Tieghemostelium lacteum]|uniref:Transmembrane protein n=1 Tax=Tieghemostelium lacteum TaxID=361077 RepID=A0A152A3U8_TIELA|nr:hypothetical protein DLAC_03017 [Tieghemostelium lacteum]|eukprot:KYR00952.1 hypothetical protein DLAC_03017 [Tieghemostelium lacteum]
MKNISMIISLITLCVLMSMVYTSGLENQDFKISDSIVSACYPSCMKSGQLVQYCQKWVKGDLLNGCTSYIKEGHLPNQSFCTRYCSSLKDYWTQAKKGDKFASNFFQ